MSNVVAKCRKCGKVYGSSANVETAKRLVRQKKCKTGGNCEADV